MGKVCLYAAELRGAINESGREVSTNPIGARVEQSKSPLLAIVRAEGVSIVDAVKFTKVKNTRGVQKVRGPTKKENEFYDETRCEGCHVIKTAPDAVTSQSVLLLCSVCWLL